MLRGCRVRVQGRAAAGRRRRRSGERRLCWRGGGPGRQRSPDLVGGAQHVLQGDQELVQEGLPALQAPVLMSHLLLSCVGSRVSPGSAQNQT